MGIINWGAPMQITTELAKLANANTFIETGTYMGGTAKSAAEHFDIVHTIEISEHMYNTYGQNITESNVTRHLGDSKNVLPEILKNISQEQSVVFWLDGHYSGGETGGAEHPYPLIEELNFVLQRPNDIILIDDARLFFSGNGKNCPTISEIIFTLPNNAKSHFVQIVDDVIFIVPSKNESIVKCLNNWAAERTNTFWINYGLQKKVIESLIQEWKQQGANKLVIFGAGNFGQGLIYIFLTQEIGLKIDFYCDNNKDKWNTHLTSEDIPCISPSQLETMRKEVIVFVSTSKIYSTEIKLQLEKIGISNIISFF